MKYNKIVTALISAGIIVTSGPVLANWTAEEIKQRQEEADRAVAAHLKSLEDRRQALVQKNKELIEQEYGPVKANQVAPVTITKEQVGATVDTSTVGQTAEEKAAEEVRLAQEAAAQKEAERLAAIKAEQDRLLAEAYGTPTETPKTETTTTETVAEETQTQEPAKEETVAEETPSVEEKTTVVEETVKEDTSIGVQLNTAQFEDKEYFADGISPGKTNDNVLDAINASSAWARGYTGAGSKILIIDSGINLNHKEFEGSITDTKSFIRRKTDVIDNVGHGTAMASIAAANRDGEGIVGVAPDADLAIAKITDNTRYGFSQARAAIKWGTEIDATVANMSANGSYASTYKRNWYQTEDGAWANNHARYITNFYTGRRSTGFYGGENPALWARALGDSEMVIVNSAGNSGLAFPENPAPMAIATKDDGTLWLRGQMLIVGAWDINKQDIATYSNKAGHICQGKNLQGGQCLDEYRISDFFIMAPGTTFEAHKSGDLYKIGTGTSEAAAVVSGAVALVHQQWPHMTGSNIVKLLTTTANKDINNYDKERHGQGLLDLEAATRPYGVVGIPVDGRYGVKVPMSGAYMTNSGGGEELAAALSSVMVADEFGREYYVDLSATATAKARRADWNPISKANFYSKGFNPYHKLNQYTGNGQVQLNDVDMKLSYNEYNSTGMFEMGHTTAFGFDDKSKLRVGFGALNEQDGWMGNMMSGMMGTVGGSYTTYTNFQGTHNLTDQFSVFGNYWMGYTQVDQTEKGLVTGISDTETYSWSAGLDYTQGSHSLGFTVSQPVSISRGTMNVSVPIGFDSNGTVVNQNHKVDMTSKVQEYDFGTYYKFNSSEVRMGDTKADVSFTGFAEHQMNYLNQEGVDNNVAGFMLEMSF